MLIVIWVYVVGMPVGFLIGVRATWASLGHECEDSFERAFIMAVAMLVGGLTAGLWPIVLATFLARRWLFPEKSAT